MRARHMAAACGAVLAAACASAGVRASDPWLGTRSANDCTQPACLFAVVTDSAGHPLSGADVEVVGTQVRATTNNVGRLSLQGIPLGSHRIRLFADGAPLESAPVAFGMTLLAITIQVRADSVVIRS